MDFVKILDDSCADATRQTAELLKAYDINNTALAERLGIDPSYLSRILSGERPLLIDVTLNLFEIVVKTVNDNPSTTARQAMGLRRVIDAWNRVSDYWKILALKVGADTASDIHLGLMRLAAGEDLNVKEREALLTACGQIGQWPTLIERQGRLQAAWENYRLALEKAAQEAPLQADEGLEVSFNLDRIGDVQVRRVKKEAVS